jgi:putative peptidoglycan lipid II flippase
LNNTKGSRMVAAAIVVMSSMVLSRLTGFIRETMLSWKVGLSWVQDAYVAAFTVPDLIYMLLVGGTISAALVPFLSGHLEKGEEREGWKAASSFINVVFIGMVLLCTLGVLFAPLIIPAVAPGFSDKSPQTRELAITLTRILFPSVSFIMLAGICNGVLNSYRSFAAAAYGPSIYNIGCTLSIILFADRNPGSMLKVAIGVAASALIYFLVQLTFAFSRFKLYQPILHLKDKGFQKLFWQAVPSLLSSSITQVNVIISTAFVSLSLFEGSLAAFRNANTAWQLPYGIFAMGVGTAMLPALSGKYVTGEFENYKAILMKSLTSVLFLSIPSAAGFIILKEPIVRAVFKWGGKFTEANVPVVASILALFSLAMITQSIVAIMNRAYYARQDTKTPLFVGIGSIIMNLGFGSVFYYFTDLGAAGMALTYSLISTVNSILLLVLLDKKMDGIHMGKFYRFIWRAVVSAIFMGAILILMEQLHPRLDTKLVQLIYLSLEILVGSALYFAMMLLTKSEDALYFFKIFKRKIGGGRRETAD